MTAPGKPDILIIEDRESEVPRICTWLGLNPLNKKVELVPNPDAKRPENLSEETPAVILEAPRGQQQTDSQWRSLRDSLLQQDPKVVVLDYLLSGESGNDPFDGVSYGMRCKETWPDMGIIIVTTGGDGMLEGLLASQKELDEQKSHFKWRFNYAWIKPWGPAAHKQTGGIVNTGIRYRELMHELLRSSRRPSEHPK